MSAIQTKILDGPDKVHIDNVILCSDGVARTVIIIDHRGGGTFRFVFSDDRWIEYKPGRKVTTVVRVVN